MSGMTEGSTSEIILRFRSIFRDASPFANRKDGSLSKHFLSAASPFANRKDGSLPKYFSVPRAPSQTEKMIRFRSISQCRAPLRKQKRWFASEVFLSAASPFANRKDGSLPKYFLSAASPFANRKDGSLPKHFSK